MTREHSGGLWENKVTSVEVTCSVGATTRSECQWWPGILIHIYERMGIAAETFLLYEHFVHVEYTFSRRVY